MRATQVNKVEQLGQEVDKVGELTLVLTKEEMQEGDQHGIMDKDIQILWNLLGTNKKDMEEEA